MIGIILLIVLLVLLIGAVPAWPYNRGWGYYPSGFLGLALVVILILVLLGAFNRAVNATSIPAQVSSAPSQSIGDATGR